MFVSITASTSKVPLKISVLDPSTLILSCVVLLWFVSVTITVWLAWWETAVILSSPNVTVGW